MRLIDADTEAFDRIMAAWRLPQGTAAEKEAQVEALQAATRHAIEIPLRVMGVACESMEAAAQMADFGMDASASDAGVSALCARMAVRGAGLNVRINGADLADKEQLAAYLSQAKAFERQAAEAEERILAQVAAKIG